MIGIPVLPNGDPVRRTVLVCASYEHANNWAMYSRVNLRSRNLIIATPDNIRGLNDFDVVYYGPYWRVRNKHLIFDAMNYYKSARRSVKEYYQYEGYNIEANVVKDTSKPWHHETLENGRLMIHVDPDL